jgi:glycerophosphoryl diester phosphodiesterase
MKRVGHKGADAIVRGNTLASFDAALDVGVDMIEFDVLPGRAGATDGPLVLAHDYSVLEHGPAQSLEEGLDHFATSEFEGVELDVDLKLPGYEGRVVEALRERGLLERTLVSTMYRSSLRALRAAEPRLRTGWSVPRVRSDPTQGPRVRSAPVYGWLVAYRRAFPRMAAAELRAGRCDAIMAHFRFVTPALVTAVRAAAGELYVWTVDDADRIAALERLGVTGVITNDPRLFATARDGSTADA